MFERRVGQQCSDGVAPVLTDQLLNQLLIAWFSKSVGYRPEEVDIPAGIELSKCRVIIVPDALPGDIGQQPVERCNKAPLLTMCHVDRPCGKISRYDVGMPSHLGLKDIGFKVEPGVVIGSGPVELHRLLTGAGDLSVNSLTDRQKVFAGIEEVAVFSKEGVDCLLGIDPGPDVGVSKYLIVV